MFYVQVWLNSHNGSGNEDNLIFAIYIEWDIRKQI